MKRERVPHEGSLHAARRHELWAGVRGVLPLLVGSIPFSIIFGALAVTSGLSPLAAAAMSAIVFAGSAQFVAVGMVGTGANFWVIVFTTFIVNLRHVLYAATLAPHLKHLSQRWLLLLGFTLTDESFVVTIQRYMRANGEPSERDWFKHWYQAGASFALYINWQFFTWVGLWAGRAIPNPASWGLDFAFPATFIGMLVPLIVSRSIVACVASAGVATLLFHHLPHKLGLIIAALCGVAAGLLVERWFPAPNAHTGEQAAHITPQEANKL